MQELTERLWLQKSAGALKPLVQHTVQAARAGELGGRELANVAYGAACSGRDSWPSVIFAPPAIAAELCMNDCNPQHLANKNTSWAFAMAGQNDASLFAALATAAQRRMGDSNLQNLANTAWAFATAGQKDG